MALIHAPAVLHEGGWGTLECLQVVNWQGGVDMHPEVLNQANSSQ